MNFGEEDNSFPTKEHIERLAHQIWKNSGRDECDANWYLAEKSLKEWGEKPCGCDMCRGGPNKLCSESTFETLFKIKP